MSRATPKNLKASQGAPRKPANEPVVLALQEVDAAAIAPADSLGGMGGGGANGNKQSQAAGRRLASDSKPAPMAPEPPGAVAAAHAPSVQAENKPGAAAPAEGFALTTRSRLARRSDRALQLDSKKNAPADAVVGAPRDYSRSAGTVRRDESRASYPAGADRGPAMGLAPAAPARRGSVWAGTSGDVT